MLFRTLLSPSYAFAIRQAGLDQPRWIAPSSFVSRAPSYVPQAEMIHLAMRYCLHKHRLACRSSTEIMPIVSSCLTWALEVDGIRACAHLQAYINVKPVVDALKLCNRFGLGSRAYVARMPAEIIQSIGEFVTEMERSEQLNVCYRQRACWSETCERKNHFDPKIIEQMYLDHLGSECECHTMAGLSEEVPITNCKILAKRVQYADLENEREIHTASKDAWQQRIGCSVPDDQGIFRRYHMLFYCDFGLQVWPSHMLSDAELSSDYDAAPSLDMRAWLILPGSRIEVNLYNEHRLYSSAMGGDRNVPTERGYQFSISLPRRPSEKSLERWPRALRILGLEAIASDPPKLYASEMDTYVAESKKCGDTNMVIGSNQVIGENVLEQPELKLLVSCSD